MSHGCLAERLERYLPLLDSERRTLAALETTERAVPRGAVLRREQAPSREIYVVQRGWLFSSLLLPDGNRQILSLHLPTDFAGDTGIPWSHAPFSLTAATDAAVRVIEKAALRDVFDRHPRLAMLILALAQADRVTLADRLASVGRTSAKSRVAALIVDAFFRLRRIGQTVADGFVLPLTQEEIGDATGLTAVHVNRMLRQLADERLLERVNGRVQLIDVRRLATVANYNDRLDVIDTSWLPAAAAAA